MATLNSGVRLSTKAETFLTSSLDGLRNSGVAEAELDSVTPAITNAIFAEFRANKWSRATCFILGSVVWVMSIIGIFDLIYSKYKESIKLVGLAFIIIFSLFVVMLSLIGKRVLLLFLDRGDRSTLKKYGLLAFMGIIFVVSLFLGYRSMQEYYWTIEDISIWTLMIILLCGIWVMAFFNIFTRISHYIYWRLLAILRPDCALIVSLCYAFELVRDKASWHDQTHRTRIARHLAVAADAIEKFMPRYVVTEADISSMAVVRQRFEATANPLRQKIIWLATPGPLTRTDLEWELRKAIIAASLGELAKLEEKSGSTQTIQVARRNWSGLLADLCRGIAWALTPLALVQLGSALKLPLLSEEQQQTAAQKAAYIWLAIAILRGLSPGNFKETMDAAGSLLGRTRANRSEKETRVD
jgi:hypothetical protein